jgi:hypothetical protein
MGTRLLLTNQPNQRSNSIESADGVELDCETESADAIAAGWVEDGDGVEPVDVVSDIDQSGGEDCGNATEQFDCANGIEQSEVAEPDDPADGPVAHNASGDGDVQSDQETADVEEEEEEEEAVTEANSKAAIQADACESSAGETVTRTRKPSTTAIARPAPSRKPARKMVRDSSSEVSIEPGGRGGVCSLVE